MRGYDVHKVQIPGTKIKPTRPLLDTLDISPPYTFFLLNDDMELHRNWQLLV